MASWSDKRFVRLRQLLRFTGNLLVPILLFSEFYQNFLSLKRKTNLSNSSKVFFRTQGPKWCISPYRNGALWYTIMVHFGVPKWCILLLHDYFVTMAIPLHSVQLIRCKISATSLAHTRSL